MPALTMLLLDELILTPKEVGDRYAVESFTRSINKREQAAQVSLWSAVPDAHIHTSNGGCGREEKSRKHWSLFTKFLFLVTAIFFFY